MSLSFYAPLFRIILESRDVRHVLKHTIKQSPSYAHGVIGFLQKISAFRDMYHTKHQVPHGFANTRIGTGHLNPAGHAAIADALYKTILGYADYRFIIIILLLSLVTWYCGAHPRFSGIEILLAVLSLGFFKYCKTSLSLPLGISFYSFSAISYLAA